MIPEARTSRDSAHKPKYPSHSNFSLLICLLLTSQANPLTADFLLCPLSRQPQDSLNAEWYVAYVSRPEAEAALRKINKVLFKWLVILTAPPS